jgi:feruloyl esterase
MRLLVAALLVGAAPAPVLADTAAAAGASDCAGLADLVIPGARVTEAAVVTALEGGIKLAAPACRVLISAQPSRDSDVRIALLIPQTATWNGKFAQVGNGGFAGKIPWGSMARASALGYATAATDNGHQDADGASAKWGLGHPEKVVDFGWRAVKTTTDVAQLVMAAAGKVPNRRYFVGCSDGGREALMTAQRFPEDFHGIVAGAPAWPWTRMVGLGGKVVQQSLLPGRALPPAKLPAVQAAALNACGNGKGWIENPRACKFDPGVLACTGAESDACLTPGQVETLRMVYQGLIDPVTGVAAPGLVPGAEALPGSWAWWGRATVPGDNADATSKGFPWNYFAYLVKDDPKFDLRNLTDTDIIAGYKRWASALDADNPDLSAFAQAGGKLIGFHGWNDPAIPPGLSLDYWQQVKARTPAAAAFTRLFMVPGMLHCTGGDAPVTIDWFAEIDRWVETGAAPATVTASGAAGARQIVTAEP